MLRKTNLVNAAFYSIRSCQTPGNIATNYVPQCGVSSLEVRTLPSFEDCMKSFLDKMEGCLGVA